MASGWAPDGAVQDQIDDTVADEVKRARARLAEPGEGPTALRGLRRAHPGAEATCAARRAHLHRMPVGAATVARRSIGFNRRGSKDSQLK